MVPGEFNTPLACVCGETGGDVVGLSERHGFPLTTKLCGCGLLRSDPYYSESELDEYYKLHYRDLYDEQASDELFDRERKKGRWLKAFVEDLDFESMLDWGCGCGGVAYEFDGRGYEIGPKAQYAERYIDVVETPEYADLVVASHVLEHMRDPVGFLAGIECKYLLVVVPALPQIVTNFMCNFIHYLQDAHVFHYSLETLEWVASLAGYKMLKGLKQGVALFEKGGEALPPPMTGDKVADLLRSSYTIFQYIQEARAD